MSKEQWGHGFHTGRESAKSKRKGGYVGLWFFTTKESGELEYQGQIRRRIDKDHWAVQRHEWFCGEASGPLIVIDKAALEELHLCEDAASLRLAIHQYRMRRPDLYPKASEYDYEAGEHIAAFIEGRPIPKQS